jgi:pyruvate dehydrogenase E2 component (dihydrolipoamide acetyltransferase)
MMTKSLTIRFNAFRRAAHRIKPINASVFINILPRTMKPSNTVLCYQKGIHNSVRYYFSTSKNFGYPPHSLFPMPALSPTMETGTIASWNLKEGDSFSAGDVLCSIETDKASVDFEAQDDGVLAKILRKGANAQDIAVGTPICVVVDDVSDIPAFLEFDPLSESNSTSITQEFNAESSVSISPKRIVADEFVLLPSARHLSQSKGIDAKGLQGTGKGGRITKGDVLAAINSGVSMPSLSPAFTYKLPDTPNTQAADTTVAVIATPSTLPIMQKATAQDVNTPLQPTTIDSIGTFHDIPNNNMRKIIARRLTESKSLVPHFYTSMEIELDNILALRKKLANNHGVKISVNDLIIRSSALALRDVPEVNATYDPKTSQISVQSSIDISVAVATPTGLITPIVPSTDKLGLAEISDKVRDLAGRARDGKLQPHEYQGGTFCISNLGMFGIDEFSAVINPPQAAILAVGGGTARVVPTPWEDNVDKQKPPQIKTIMTARLSADRRVVDEATAGLFLSALRQYLNKPELLLL